MLFTNYRFSEYKTEKQTPAERYADEKSHEEWWKEQVMIKRMQALHVKAQKSRRNKIKISRKSKKLNRK